MQNFPVAQTILNGRGDLGLTEAFTQTDFAITHRFKFGASERFQLALNFNVLNLFNEANVLRVQNSIQGSGTLTTASLPLGTDSELEAINIFLTQGIINQVNAFFNSAANPQRRNTALGLANGFQGGREVRFGVRFEF